MPDFGKMVSVGKAGRSQDSLNKPFDAESLFNLGESEGRNSIMAPKMTRSLERMFTSMGNSISSNRTELLSEDLLNENLNTGD